MNMKTIVLSWLFLSFLVPGLAMSGEMRMIKVALDYSGSAASYNLYKDGVKVCTRNVPGATQMDCSVELDATPMAFTLAAVDEAGLESSRSAPYILNPPPPALDTGVASTSEAMPRPTALKVKIR